MIDRTSRWAEAVPLSSITASACADALCSTWIARFGIPHTITSDRGTQFTSALWSHLNSFLQIEHNNTNAFHPQSNGIVERFHGHLKDTLRARCNMPDWVRHLPWLLFSFRSTPHEKSNFSPAEATFGSPLVLPAQFPFSPDDDSFHFLRNLQSSLSGSLSQPHANSPPPPLPPELLSAPFVFIRAPPPPPTYLSPPSILAPSRSSAVLPSTSSFKLATEPTPFPYTA
jgi:transposase InsO family protein